MTRQTGAQDRVALPPLDALPDAIRARLQADEGSLRLRSSLDATRVVRLLEELAEFDERLALEVAANLSYVLGFGGADLAWRWALTGLDLFRSDPATLSKYMRLEVPLARSLLEKEGVNRGFEGIERTLRLFLCALLGREIAVGARLWSSLTGPALRVSGGEDQIIFPEGFSSSCSPDETSIFLAAAAHMAAHLRFSLPARPVLALKPMSVAVISLIEDARVEALMAREYPGFAGLWRAQFPEETPQTLTFEGLCLRLSRALIDRGYEDGNYWVAKGARLFRQLADRLDDYAAFREIGSVLANDLGQLRVRFEASKYVPQPAYRDDNSVLWRYASDEPPEAAHIGAAVGVRVEFDEGGDAVPDLGGLAPSLWQAEYLYPEWDYRSSVTRDDWVTVKVRWISASSAHAPGSTPADQMRARGVFRAWRAQRLNRASRIGRQWEGDTLDLNAAIAAMVDMRSALTPDARVFVRPGRTPRSPHVLLLLDLSESTNDRLPGRFESLLDVLRGAAEHLCSALSSEGIDFAVHGFSSNGRNEIEYVVVKEWNQPADAAVRHAIRSLQAQHSTRLGAALRHARACFPARRDGGFLVVLTDGEPSDIDVWDKRYLVEDAARAVWELRSSDIGTFCLSLDAKGQDYVTRIFGSRHLMVDRPGELARRLSDAIERLAAHH